jgi:signal recognition particle subunit SEC65
MFTELKLTDDLTIFTSTISNIDNELLAEDLEYNCEVAKDTYYGGGNPGKQATIVVTSKNIELLKNEILKKISSVLKLDANYICSYDAWVYISDNKNKISEYHSHITEGNLYFSEEIPHWSIIYYAEVPNNSLENDGKLFFKTKTKEVSILPYQNQIIMFPADVLHKAGLNPNSTNKRVVYAVNISILDRNKKYKKLNKTLL